MSGKHKTSGSPASKRGVQGRKEKEMIIAEANPFAVGLSTEGGRVVYRVSSAMFGMRRGESSSDMHHGVARVNHQRRWRAVGTR